MTTAKLEIHFDKDDKIDKYMISKTGGAAFEDAFGEIRGLWYMRSKEELLETLMKVREALQGSHSALT